MDSALNSKADQRGTPPPSPHFYPYKNYNKRGQMEFRNGRFSTARWYDAAGRMNSLQFDPVPYGPANFLNYGFAFNPAQQITTRTTSLDAYVYTGDNNVNRNYAVNGLNQYSSAGSATFSYDGNGNLTGDGSNSYVYDAENRLVSADGASLPVLRVLRSIPSKESASFRHFKI